MDYITVCFFILLDLVHRIRKKGKVNYMKKIIILLSILVMMCALVACGNEEKEKEELYDEEKAISYDKNVCSTIKNCFNASMCVEDAYMEVVKSSGRIVVSVGGNGEITFFPGDNYINIEKELEDSISDIKAPQEKGKSAYCITWEADGKKVSNIKVETVE